MLTVTIAIGDDSVEAAARARTLALMERVRDAEASAATAGATLGSREAWESFLAR